MEWIGDDVAQVYTLTQGTCHAKVWYSVTDHWSAFVHHAGGSIGQHSFTTVQDAQAWCEAQLSVHIADGHCTTRSEGRQ